MIGMRIAISYFLFINIRDAKAAYRNYFNTQAAKI